MSWLKGKRQLQRRGPPRLAIEGVAQRRLRLEELEHRVVPASTLSVGDATFNLAAGAAGFQVTRTGDLTPAIDIGYSIADGTATSGTNYTSTAPTGVLDFASGQTTATIPLTILSNNFPQSSLSFTVDLTGVVATFGPPATFAAVHPFTAGTHPMSVTEADLNSDGKLDLIVANFGSNTLSVFMNTTAPGATTASFATQQTFATGTGPFSVTTADLNGDGRPDLVVANSESNTVSVLMNTTAAGATTASFATQQTFATGTGPVSVTTADLNGDGRPDLIVADEGANEVSVLLNTTAAGATTVSFATQETFATGSAPRSVTTADINGDGLPDIITADYGSAEVSVLLNTTAPGATTASFAAQTTFATGAQPSSVAVADLNGDGLPDIITANYGSANVSVLLNTTAPGATTSSFAAQQTIATGNGPRSVTAVDLNGDGRPDLVVGNYNSFDLSVLLNTTVPGATAVSFAPQQTHLTGNGPFSLAIGDLNGDGLPDIAVANYTSGTVGVLLNTTSYVEATAAGVPSPDFIQAAAPAAGTNPYSVTVADINGDGRPDLVVANFGSDTVSVLMNTSVPGSATPTFATEQSFAVGSGPFSVAVADLNEDGLLDIIVTDYDAGSISVLMNTTAAGSAAASFGAAQTFVVGTQPHSVAVADVNGDGLPDLLVANYGSNTISVLMNTTAPGASTASFATQQTFATGINPHSVAVADVNGDGLPDLIVANEGSNTVSVLLNTTTLGSATPSFATQQTFATGSNPTSVVAGDVSGEGLPALIVSNYDSATVSVLLNTTAPGATTASFDAQQTFAVGTKPISVTLADVNGDGKNDIIVANSPSATATVLLNTTVPGSSTPTFDSGQSFATGSEPNFVAVGDLNGNGLPDLVVANFGGTVSVLMNSPAVVGTNPATGTIESAPVVSSIALADANPSTAATVDFTVTFSEAVSGVVAGNFELSGTGTAGASIGTPTTTDGGIIWNVPVTTGASGTLGLTLDDRTGIVDSNGNQLYNSTSDNGSVFSPVVGPDYTIDASTTTTVTSSANPSTYGQSVTFTATIDDASGSGVPTGSVEFFSGSTDLGAGTTPTGTGNDAISTFAISSLMAGTDQIDAVYSATGSFTSSTSANLSQTVDAAALTITADNQTKVYGAALPTLTASYTGFVNGDTSASLTTQPTLTTTATAASGVSGSPYPITASGAVDPNYTISYVAGSLTITTSALTITADNQTKVYGAALPTLTASYTGFINGDTSASLTTQPTLTTTATAASSVAGSPYPITASGAVDPNYTISYVAGSLTITTAALTITADNQTKVYGAALPTLTASYTGFVNGDTAASLTTQPTLTTTATAASSVAGSPYPITASGAVDANYTITYVAGSLTVTTAALTITADNQTKIYGAALPTLTASYTGFVNGDTSASLTTQPTLTTTATAASSVAGSPYPITASGAVDANYTITYVAGSLTVTTAALTITADNQTKIYGAALPTLTASYTGFVNGDTSASLTTQPTLTTTATAFSSVSGSPYPITASGAVDPNYTISYGAGSLTITAATLTITADNQTKVYGAALPALTASYTGFVNGDTSASLTTLPTLTTTATAASSVAGSPYPITASGAVDPNYTISYVAGSLTITTAALTITADNQTKVYGAALPTLTASYTGLVNGDTSANLTTQPTLTTTATAASSVAGSPYPITATGAVDPDYTISYVAGSLTVTAATLTITADNQTKVYGAALPALTASYTGFVNGDTSASLTTQPTLTTTATAASSVAGSPYPITASGAVDPNYTISYVAGSLTVTTAALTITADNQTKVYGAALPALTASYTGFVNGDTSADLTTLPTLTTTATASSTVAGNPYSITASGAVDPNYTISYVAGSLTVTTAALTITADNQTKVYGAALPALTASYTGLVNGDTSASLTTQPTLTTTATAASSVAGSPYSITASGAVDSNYTISYVAGTLTVTPVALTITADNQTKVYGAALPVLTASYTGFVNGDTSASLTTQPTLTTTATAASSVAGSPYPITASGAVDPNYTISYVAGSLTVTTAALTITADNQTKVYGAALPALTASYTGFVNGDTSADLTTLPTLTTTATASSTVAGNPYSITASGAVDPNYTISYVAGSLTVTTAALTITADNQTKVYGAALPALTASYTGLVNGDTSASLTTQPTLTTTATAASSVAGSPYSITASGAVDSNYTISYVAGTLTVTPVALTITADNQTKVYGAALPVLTASYTGFVNGDTSASLTTQPTLTTTATAASSVAGSPYPITASGAVDPNYTISYVAGSLTVTTAALTITADNQTKVYGAALPALTASYTGFVNGDTSADLTTLPTLTTTATASSTVAGNPYSITASGAVDPNYTISYVAGSLTVTTAALTITADNQTKVYGAALPTLTASYTGFVNGNTSADLTTLPTLTTTATASSTVAGNPYSITASGAVDPNYTISYVAGSLTVTTAALTITANNQTKAYGAALPTLTDSFSGFVNGDTSASLTTQPTLTTTATAGSPVSGNPYAITASGAVDLNYTISYVAGTLTVTPAALTITANNQISVLGATLPPLTASYSGFVNGDTSASLTTQPTLTTTATSNSPISGNPYSIAVSGAVDSNYTISYVSGFLTMTTGPVAVITSEPPLFSNSSTATFSFTSSDSNSQISYMQTELDGAAFAPATSPQTFTNLSNGSHTFVVEAVDTAGDVSPPVSYTWTVDASLPTAIITSHPPLNSGSATAAFSFLGVDPISGINYLETEIDGGAFAPATSPQTFSNLSNGSHTFEVEAVDNAGNISAPVSYTWTVAVAPTAGTITVAKTGSTLVITGVNNLTAPGLNNESFTLTGGALGAVTVAADAGTTIANPPLSLAFTGITSVTMTMGSGNDSAVLDGLDLTGNVGFSGAGGNDSFTLESTALDTIGSVTYLNSGGGSSLVNIGGTTTIDGGLSISSGVGNLNDSLGSTGATLTVKGLTIHTVTGNSTTVLNGTIVDSGGLTTNLGAGANQFTSNFNLDVAGNVSLNDGIGSSANTLLGVTSITGNLTVMNQAGFNQLTIGGTSYHSSGYIMITDGAGGSNTTISATTAAFGGLAIVAGAGPDNVTLSSTFTSKSIVVTLGQGVDNLILSGTATIYGNLSITTGTGNDVVSISSAVTLKGALGVSMGSGNDLFSWTGAASTIAGAATIAVGAGMDAVMLDNLTFNGAVTLTTGAGNDLVEMNAITANSTVALTTGNGSDQIEIQTAPATASSTFHKGVSVLMGSANDTLDLGLSSPDPSDTLTFLGAVRLNGGLGLNTLNDEYIVYTSSNFVVVNFVGGIQTRFAVGAS